MWNNESKYQVQLDAALESIKESNRLLMHSILARDSKAIEKRVVRLRASRWKLIAAIRDYEKLLSA
jgi:hypothetical protein